jgi:hypothetical protein
MKWYYILLLVCLVIGPFDALYMYIKAEKRRDALKKRKQKEEEDDSAGSDR